MNKIIYLICIPWIVLTIKPNKVIAQQEKGQIIIAAGAGFSPLFDGDIIDGSALIYPLTTNYSCNFTSILPNLGITIDYNVIRGFSVGFATSYQSIETIRDYGATTDKITRTNIAWRFLGHFMEKNPHTDQYLGVRVGCSIWSDSPLHNNKQLFIKTPAFLPSLQMVYVLNVYLIDNFGLHGELGIGSPYCAEAGLVFRINTKKTEEASKK